MDHHRGDRAVHAARKRAKHLLLPYLFTESGDRFLHKGIHGPVPRRAAHVIEERPQHLVALGGVLHFEMELHGIEISRAVLHRGNRAGFTVSGRNKSLRQSGNIIGVAHPDNGIFRYAGKKRGLSVSGNSGLAVFPDGRRLHLAAQKVRHELRAVADAQHGHAQRKDLRRIFRGCFLIDAVGAAGENNADIPLIPNGFNGSGEGLYLGIYAQIAHSSGDELVVLPSEIKHQYLLMFHVRSHSFAKKCHTMKN